jgi:hypothetical protein
LSSEKETLTIGYPTVLTTALGSNPGVPRGHFYSTTSSLIKERQDTGIGAFFLKLGIRSTRSVAFADLPLDLAGTSLEGFHLALHEGAGKLHGRLKEENSGTEGVSSGAEEENSGTERVNSGAESVQLLHARLKTCGKRKGYLY